MRNYWSCTPLANKIRGTDKPDSASGPEWAEWNARAKAQKPFRYWLAEEGLDKLQHLVNFPIDAAYSMKYYIVNRWVSRSHTLTANPKDLKPGTWYDLDTRIIFCMFNELVNYVEVDLAYQQLISDPTVGNRRWWQVGMWRTRTWRSAKDGMDYLKWASEIEDSKGNLTPQAIGAIEIMDLYHWWTVDRPGRPDPYDVSGWTAYCAERESRGIAFLCDDPDTDPSTVATMLDAISDVERAYDEEDTACLVRLVRIRKQLWT